MKKFLILGAVLSLSTNAFAAIYVQRGGSCPQVADFPDHGNVITACKGAKAAMVEYAVKNNLDYFDAAANYDNGHYRKNCELRSQKAINPKIATDWSLNAARQDVLSPTYVLCVTTSP